MNINILGIESSCDDTSAAVIQNGILLSNVIAGQAVHEKYGGVVPELASRAHQQNIIPVVSQALTQANISKDDVTAVAFTRGPGLLGSLLVGVSFTKGFTLAQKIPMIEVNHLAGHILAHFIGEPNKPNHFPTFPFLCLLVSGGHTQLIVVKDYFEMEIIGHTIDDAAGEAFDKCAKTMGLPYPGGPEIDKLAAKGNPLAFTFNKPNIKEFDFSFSGLKTSFLYFLRDNLKQNPRFIEENLPDLCASLQRTIIEILADKTFALAQKLAIKEVAIAGGVSANAGLRQKFTDIGEQMNYKIFLPPLKYTTDNAAMIAIAGYHKYLRNDFSSQDIEPITRMNPLMQ